MQNQNERNKIYWTHPQCSGTKLAKFIPNLSEISAPLRKLLEKDTAWHWEEAQERSVEKLKHMITHSPTFKFYDVSKPVPLSVDASSEGIGAVILQEGRPVAYGSRAWVYMAVRNSTNMYIEKRSQLKVTTNC